MLRHKGFSLCLPPFSCWGMMHPLVSCLWVVGQQEGGVDKMGAVVGGLPSLICHQFILLALLLSAGVICKHPDISAYSAKSFGWTSKIKSGNNGILLLPSRPPTYGFLAFSLSEAIGFITLYSQDFWIWGTGISGSQTANLMTVPGPYSIQFIQDTKHTKNLILSFRWYCWD